MVDFLSSIQRGLQSARFSQNEQSEIDHVIADLGRQALTITNGLATIAVREFSRPAKNAVGLAQFFDNETFKALALVSANDASVLYKIAEWFQDSEGYPVQIMWNKTSYICPNQEGLEQALLKIVSHSSFGIIMRNIIDGQDLVSPLQSKVQNKRK